MSVTYTYDSGKGPAPLFQIPINAGTESISIDVHAPNALMTSPHRMMLFDDTGRELLEGFSDPKSHSIHIHLMTAELFLDGTSPRALFLQVFQPSDPTTVGTSQGGVTAVPMAATGFLLSVDRQTVTLGASDASDATGRVPSPSPGVVTTWPDVWVSAPGGPIASRATLSTITADPAALPGRVATGPLPTRAAAASGGFLSDRDNPAPAESRGDTAAVEQALTDPPGAAPDGDRADDPGVASTDGVEASLRGPGGFPLLGTALIATGLGSGEGLVDRLPVIACARSSAPGSTVAPLPPEADARNGATLDPVASDRPCRTSRRLSALTGVSVALAFVSGVILPDPARVGPPYRSWVRGLLRKPEASGTT